MKLETLDSLETASRRILLRIDVNSPIDPSSGRILDEHRFRNHRATFRELEDSAVVVLAHQSRPGRDDFTTTERHAEVLEGEIGREVEYVPDYFGPEARRRIKSLDDGDVLMLENVRFYSEEVLTDLSGGRQENSHPVESLAPLVDAYVNDAFACSHRNQISLVGFPKALPSAAGRLVEREVAALDRASPGEGTLFLLGGAKLQDSLTVAESVLEEGSEVAATGLFANLLLDADGNDLGGPSEEILVENCCGEHRERAESLLDRYGDDLHLPVDLAAASGEGRMEMFLDELPVEEQLQDVGLETVSEYRSLIDDSDAVVCNGPAGVFEERRFAVGTEELLKAMADSSAFTVLGGGHIVTALRRAGLEGSMDHVSSGGGALLNYVAGNSLPGLETIRM